MEDRNALVADCIVVSCCCQCLLLQVVVFILLRLPSRMIRRARRYVKNLRARNREGKGLRVNTRRGEGDDEGSGRSQIHQVDGFFSFRGRCMDEVERVLDELSQNGEFAFGSFWGGDAHRKTTVILTCQTKQELDCDLCHVHLIQT